MHFSCANGSCIETGHCCFPKAAISIAGAKVTFTRKRHLNMSVVKWNISHLLTAGSSSRGTETWCRIGSLGESHLPAAFPGRAQGIKVGRSCRKPGASFCAFPPQVSWVQPSQARGSSKTLLKLRESNFETSMFLVLGQGCNHLKVAKWIFIKVCF